MTLPDPIREDFLLIPGVEITGKRNIHTTALNVKGYAHHKHPLNSKTEVIQSHIDSTRGLNGIPILNHPNFGTGAQVGDVLPVEHLHMIEVFNGHPGVHD